jgi:hypothetical protein
LYPEVAADGGAEQWGTGSAYKGRATPQVGSMALVTWGQSCSRDWQHSRKAQATGALVYSMPRERQGLRTDRGPRTVNHPPWQLLPNGQQLPHASLTWDSVAVSQFHTLFGETFSALASAFCDNPALARMSLI